MSECGHCRAPIDDAMSEALLVHAAADRTIVPKRITDDSAEFGNASPEFLAVLD